MENELRKEFEKLCDDHFSGRNKFEMFGEKYANLTIEADFQIFKRGHTLGLNAQAHPKHLTDEALFQSVKKLMLEMNDVKAFRQINSIEEFAQFQVATVMKWFREHSEASPQIIRVPALKKENPVCLQTTFYVRGWNGHDDAVRKLNEGAKIEEVEG